MPSRMTKAQRTIFAWRVLSFSSVLVLTATTASGLLPESGTVQIIVTDQNGTPISNVNLCLAMPGQSVQKMTDQNGRYTASLPVGSTTVRTSRNGYANAQATVAMTNGANFVRQIFLQTGQATPLPSDCGGFAGTATGGSSGCDRITNLEVVGVPVPGGWKTTKRTISVVAGFSEKPAFYRLTEFSAAERYPESQFNPDVAFAKKNVAWLPITTPVLTLNFTLTEPHYGTHHLYIQTSLALNGCVSHAHGISVVLEPGKLVTYELTGQALDQFIAAAKTRGYRFKAGEFKFNKKDNTYCPNGAMLLPSDPVQDERVSNKVLEDVSASVEEFDGPDLMLYWQLMEIHGSFPGLPTLPARAFAKGTSPAVVYDKYSEPSCPYCGARALKRTLSWRRLVYEFRSPPPKLPALPGDLGRPALPGSYNAVQCITVPDLTRSDQQPSIVKLTLRGPAGDDPVNALGDLRSNTFQAIQPFPPPRIIMPRSIDEETRQDLNEPVAAPAAP
ncbi:exported protein of unknown function [Nitrospira japonica]|uniref:Big-1 domain-containing protein n=2 Tax=Nitrospira japonica TaxID=1325564 RepID=A0A1W1I867_9BACT|nr:exported protein of unknown function [Nitrospira japonica]